MLPKRKESYDELSFPISSPRRTEPTYVANVTKRVPIGQHLSFDIFNFDGLNILKKKGRTTRARPV